MKTVGISPKVKVPAGVLFGLGVLLLVGGGLLGEPQLQDAGGALVAASGLGGLIGYAAGPGTVE